MEKPEDDRALQQLAGNNKGKNPDRRLETWRCQWQAPGTCLPVCSSQSWDVQVLPQLFSPKKDQCHLRQLLKMPHVRQGDHDDANHDTVDDKYPQSIGLQVANEPCDGGVTHDRGNDNTNDKRRLHPGRQALLMNLVRLQQGGACDERSREQKAEANCGLSRHVAEQSRSDG